MLSHTYATDSQTKSTDLAATILAASSPPQISAACTAIESFLHKRTPDQTRWFFSITFPTLICKIFGFDDSPFRKPNLPNGWIDVVTASNDSELAARVFSLLSPNGVLMSSISAVDRLSLVKYVFPIERLPEWVRFMLQSERDGRVLADLCPLFKGRVSNKGGSSYQVQLNVFEYYMFWFAYYPVCKGNSENCDAVKVRRGRRFRLENWAYSIPVFANNTKRGRELKSECSLYIQILYAYLHAFVPVSDLTAHQPYRSSLLHYSSGYDASVIEHTEFLVYTLIHFWLVDNDFSPLPVNVCKSFGVNFPFRSVLGETPPTAGLGEIVNVFVKYLNLSSIAITDGSDKLESTESPRWRVSGSGSDKLESTESPRWRVSGSVDVVKLRGVGFCSVGSWNSWIQRPLYRFILRTLIFCPMETSIKNASQVFYLWISYIEPWTISLEDFAGLDANAGISSNDTKKENMQSPSCGYSTSWQGFVLINYLFYSSLVMHFFGFAHKFVHTDTEVIVQMVSKVLNILTSSKELIDLIKNVDTVFHSKPSGSSKSMLNNLYRFVPSIREQLQDWEDGLCESDADGSFLHENWNKDLQLFSDGDDGGQQLLQLFVLRAESELQAVSGNNLAHNLCCLDSLKAQMGCLFGNSTVKTVPANTGAIENQHPRDNIFSPRMVVGSTLTDIKYKGDWMKRPISNDEIEWLAKLLVTLSNWLNRSLGLNQRETSHEGPAWSYVEVSRDASNVFGPSETMKVVLCSIGDWLISLVGAAVKHVRGHGMRVNLRMLASKKIVTILLMVAMLSALKKAVAAA